MASPGSQQAEERREASERRREASERRREHSEHPPSEAERAASGGADQVEPPSADEGEPASADEGERSSRGADQAERASSGPADEIGTRVAAHRARRGMKVSELARQVGVSPSLISQIERGQSRPSVSTLFALAEALEVPVDAFFRDSDGELPAHVEAARRGGDETADADETAGERRPAPGHRYMVRKDERAAIDIEGGVRWERLTPTTLDHVDFMELVYAPRAESNPTLYRHPGTEMVLVMEGRMDIYVGFERHELGPGDSIHFPSSFPHRYVNPTDEVTRAVTVILHDEGGRPPSAPQRRS